MNDHDVTAVLERLIEPLDDEVGSWDDVLVRAAEPRPDDVLDRKEPAHDRRPGPEHSRGRNGRWRHRRRVLVLAVAALVVVVGTASAFGTVHALFFGSAGSRFQDPVWSPDGRKISFLKYQRDASGDVSTDVYVINADGSGQRKLTDALEPNRGFRPILSPDWRKIAFLRNPCYAVQGACTGNTTIYVMNADGSAKRRLARGGSVSVRTICFGQPQGPCDGLAWSPDGRRIAFMSDRDGNSEIYVVNADGSEERRLTREPEFDSVRVWSPDGRKMAFVRSIRDGKGPPRRQEIYVMNADGSGQRLLARGSGPAWSPDGRRIAFRSARDGNGEVYVVNVDGSGLRRLTRNPGPDGGPFWSPNGRKLFFEGRGDVHVMNADGSGQRNLTRNPAPPRDAEDSSPVLSRDGRRIAFVSQRDGAQQIYVMNADGSGLRRLTRSTG